MGFKTTLDAQVPFSNSGGFAIQSTIWVMESDVKMTKGSLGSHLGGSYAWVLCKVIQENREVGMFGVVFTFSDGENSNFFYSNFAVLGRTNN